MKRGFVRVLIKDRFNRLLVINQGTKKAPRWNFPGGKVEPGESFENAAIRETLEETGLKVLSMSCVSSTVLRIDGELWEGKFFLADAVTGKPRLAEPDKAIELRFRGMSELYSLPSIQDLLSEVGNSTHARSARPAWKWEGRAD